MSKGRMALAACAALLIAAPAADAAGGKKEGTPADPQAKHFVKKISVERMTAHQQDLQDIADANGGNRAAVGEDGGIGAGYQASVDYVVDELESYGYDAQINMFNHPFWVETQASVLRTPAKTYVGGDADSDPATVDYIPMGYSSRVVLNDAQVVPVDIQTPPTATRSSGCQAEDFAGLDLDGKVALIQRGGCAFVDKWANAEAAGAAAVIIFNDKFTDDRVNPQFVDDFIEADTAAVISSYQVGKDLLDQIAATGSATVDFEVYGALQDRFLPQVLANTRQGDRNNVVVVGAHLDSVPAGPGINDDGSGTAMLLTFAEELSQQRYKLRQQVRFMFFGAEEDGLVGSQYYAHSLSDAEVAKIDAMLDYDMLASPNYARFVYDGDGSEPGNEAFKGPEGSGFIEQLHDDWFDAQGQFNERIPFDGRSDYVGFTDEGIPAGGIFSGAEVPKTEEQEAIYGGDAGSAYDPCYHEACDSTATVFSGIPPLDAGGLDGATDAERAANAQKMAGLALKSYDEMSDAASYTTWYLATQDTPFSDAPAGKKKGKHKAGKRLHARPLHKRSR